MTVPTVIVVLAAAALTAVARRQGAGRALAGWRRGGRVLLQVLPVMVPALLIAGLLPLALPRRWISGLLGDEAGLGGVLLGAATGGLLGGGPYAVLPIIRALYDSGAGLAAVVALVTAWITLNVVRLPFELALLGGRFALTRIALTWWVPFVTGVLAWWLG